MDPFSLTTACCAVIATCIKVSKRLNSLIEESKRTDEVVTEYLRQTASLHSTLRAIKTTLLNHPTATSFLKTDRDAAQAMAQAVIGSGSAIARFETILNGVLPSPKPVGIARKALASHRLQERSSELHHIRQQIQTYTGILQMALQTITVSLLLRETGPTTASSAILTTKARRLVGSINTAEENLAKDQLDPAQRSQFEFSTTVTTPTANSVLEQACRTIDKASERMKSCDDTSEFGFTFLESNSSDPKLGICATDHPIPSRVLNWIEGRATSDGTDCQSDSMKQPPISVLKEAWLLPQTADQSETHQEDGRLRNRSNDSLNLAAGLATIFVDLGDQSLAEDEFALAERYYVKALDRLGNSPSNGTRRDLEQKIGVSCLEQGKYEEATAIFNRYPDLVRSVTSRIYLKAKEFYDQKQYQCTTNCLRRPLANPHDTPSHLVREMRLLSGLAYLALDDLQAAEDQLLLVLLPDNLLEDSRSLDLEARYHLAITQFRRGNLDEAMMYAQTASDGRFRLYGRHHIDCQNSIALLVEILEARGDTEDAKAYEKLLTEVHLEKRRAKSRLVALRGRISPLQDETIIGKDEASLTNQIEHFLVGYVANQGESTGAAEDDSSLLFRATQEGKLPIVQILLRDPKIDVSARDPLRNTVLHYAVQAGFKELVTVFLNHMGDEVNMANKAGETPLTIATRQHDLPILHLLLKHPKIDPNKETRRRNNSKVKVSHGPALHIACQDQAESVVKCFLRKNIDVNLRDAQGRVPLHYALFSGNAEISSMLLEHPKIEFNNTTEPENQSPLCLAISKDMDQVARSLIATREVNVNRQDHQGHGALHHSAWRNRPNVMAHLLKRRSIDVNAKDLCGRTALHVAATFGNVELVKLLLADNRVKANCTNKYGETPLAAAMSANHKGVVDLLHRATVESKLGEYGLLKSSRSKIHQAPNRTAQMP